MPEANKLVELGLADENEVQIRDLLDILTDLVDQQEVLAAPYKERITTLKEEMSQTTGDLDEQIKSLQKAVRQAVIAHGASIKTARVQVSFVQPRVTWDSKRLEGYAEAHPEIKSFRKVGQPSVRITVVPPEKR